MIWIGQIGPIYAQIYLFKSTQWMKGFRFHILGTSTHTSIKFSIYLTEITWWWWWEFSFCINEFPEKTLSGILSHSLSQSAARLMVCKIGKSLPQAQSQILWKSLNRMAAWIDCFLCATSTLWNAHTRTSFEWVFNRGRLFTTHN